MALFLVVVSVSVMASENTLNGPLAGTLGPGTFLVTGDITVPGGSRLLLRGGTTLCFNGFYTFTVHGSLITEGTLQNRVTLTSARDSRCGNGTPEPMDWNHLEISADAGSIELKNLDVLFSTDGILCAAKAPLLEGVVLEKNGIDQVLLDGVSLKKASQGVFQTPVMKPAPIVGAETTPIPEEGGAIRRNRRHYYIAGAAAMAAIGGACLYLLTRDKKDSEPDAIPDPPPPSRAN